MQLSSIVRPVAHLPLIRPVARRTREGLVKTYRPWHRRSGLLQERQIIFLIGHMRSGSSMLSQVLCAHPQIAGMGELHRVYRTHNDLDDITIWLQRHVRRQLHQSCYVLDKVLHDRLLPDVSLLTDSNIKCIFLTREPASSIRSMATRLRRLEMYNRVDLATDYYEKRLSRMVDYVRAIPSERAFYLDYSQLTEQTETCLNGLRAFLGLSSDLYAQYGDAGGQIRWGLGDASEHIKEGHIKVTKTSYDIELSDDLLERATTAYRNARQRLCEQAITPDLT